MKMSDEQKKKISDTMKARGIKPTVRPSREQCIKNLKLGSREPWNKGLKGVQTAWNKGISYEAIRGEKNSRWRGGKARCTDCSKQLSHYRQNSRCRDCYIVFNRGENHYKWKGGTGQPERRTGEYKNWRKKVYERDWFSCQMPMCCYYGKNIEAHHIIPVRSDEHRIYDLDNGITLCKDCHNYIRNREHDYASLFFKTLESIKSLAK